jgi:hypothetical protein
MSGRKPPSNPPTPAQDGVARYWYDRYVPTDARASQYAARYRSVYVWVFILAVLALLFGASTSGFGSVTPADPMWREVVESLSLGFAVAEFATVCCILLLVLLGRRQEWHERSIEYRLLAELCRKQQVLAPLGGALPTKAAWRTATSDHAIADRAHWVAWLFAAEQRAAPLPTGELAHAANGEPRRVVLEDLIEQQLHYHKKRTKMADGAGRRLERLGEILFGLVLVCLVVKFAFSNLFHLPDWALPFSLVATVLPGISAACVSFRAYAELQLLSMQSRHMVAALQRSKAHLERLYLDCEPKRSLLSQDLVAEAASLATIMLQDLDGWARLFRVKGIETT